MMHYHWLHNHLAASSHCAQARLAFGCALQVCVLYICFLDSAHHLASKDDSVLLSPACASFDLFENFEDRGRQFKNAVRKL